MAYQNKQNDNKKDALKDYVEVNVRIEKFYEKYPNGRILTDLISWNDGVVVMKATIYRDSENENPAATGHAYEKEGSSFINKTSALENCETSAVGRALAMLGFEIKKSVASKEEVENAKLNQNQKPQPVTQKTVGDLKLVILQFADIRKKTDKDVYGALKISDDLTKLNEVQAQLLIKKVQGWIDKAVEEAAS